MKKLLKPFLFLIILILCINISFNVFASENLDVYYSGESIGLSFDSGIEVIGKYPVETSKGMTYPWQNLNIEIGDEIFKINDTNVYTFEQLTEQLNKSKEEVTVGLKRNNNIHFITMKPSITFNDQKSLGLYVKDKTIGVGTLSFITKDGSFASLGHGIYENNHLIENFGGTITKSIVTSIKKGSKEVAGSKVALIDKKPLGKIISLTSNGCYGKLNEPLKLNKKLVKIAKPKEVYLGKGLVYTVIDNQKVKGYECQIVEIYDQDKISPKGLKVKILSEELLDRCGGIVQGMSGSPIIMNNQLVGVLSHVIVDQPQYGYGVYAYWMYKELAH